MIVKTIEIEDELRGARCSSMIRAFAQGVIPHGGPIELILVAANARQLV